MMNKNQRAIGELESTLEAAFYASLSQGQLLRQAQSHNDLGQLTAALGMTVDHAMLLIESVEHHDKLVREGRTHWQAMTKMINDGTRAKVFDATMEVILNDSK